MRSFRFTAARRRYAYRVARVGLMLGAAYGLIQGEFLDLWMLAAGELFGVADRRLSEDDE